MMRARFILPCLAAIGAAFPAQAETARKAPQQQDITKQETVALGDNRFLIFSGTAAGGGQYGYTVDLVKIEDGIPHFDPLFIEDYNEDTNKAQLDYGVAFMALSYHFNKSDNTMSFTTEDEENHTRMQLNYKLDVDIFKLQKVVSQKIGPCPKKPCTPSAPTTVFKAVANAKTH
jgi:hypothetical protein